MNDEPASKSVFPCPPTRPELLALLEASVQAVKAMSSAEVEEMCREQGRSWARAEAGKPDL